MQVDASPLRRATPRPPARPEHLGGARGVPLRGRGGEAEEGRAEGSGSPRLAARPVRSSPLGRLNPGGGFPQRLPSLPSLPPHPGPPSSAGRNQTPGRPRAALSGERRRSAGGAGRPPLPRPCRGPAEASPELAARTMPCVPPSRAASGSFWLLVLHVPALCGAGGSPFPDGRQGQRYAGGGRGRASKGGSERGREGRRAAGEGSPPGSPAPGLLAAERVAVSRCYSPMGDRNPPVC